MEWNCGNGIAEIGGKKNFQLVCGNAIAKIGGKKFVAIVAVLLPNMGGKKKLVVAEIWGGIKKKNVTFTIFLQQITCD